MKNFAVLAFVSLFLLACSGRSPSPKPNIVLILSDDQGWGDLSVSGNRNLETPNIDRLAQSGVTFDRFYVSPVCSPTRAELLTGRYHVRGGVYSTSAGGERLDLDETTIAEVFKSAGYATAAYGKWHNGMQPPYHPNARGFDDFYGFCSGHWGNYFGPMLEHNGQIVRGSGFITDDLFDHGIRFIEEHRGGPFLLYLPLNTPHSPMQVPDQWWEKFESRELQQRHRDPEKEDVQFTRAALAMCENIDWNVGRLLARIDELGISEQTIVVYFSDNGPNSWRWNGGMKGRKGSTDEGGVRSPLIIRWNGHLQPGKTITEIAAAMDLLPTLVDMAGLDLTTPKPLDGISLKPLLSGKSPNWPDRLIVSHWGNRTSVRSRQFRLDDQDRLFDMQRDPGQGSDVSSRFPTVAQRLIRGKAEWESSVLSELPEHDARPFPIGHPDFTFTQLPARDGVAHGNIKRSNQFPNCSFFTNWISTEDSIAWDVEVLEEGDFEVELHYTCPARDTGATIEFSLGTAKLVGTVTDAHDPPLEGMENDRVPRGESYVKDFRPLRLGTIHLPKGTGTLSLRALEIPGTQAMDFRLIMLRRL